MSNGWLNIVKYLRLVGAGDVKTIEADSAAAAVVLMVVLVHRDLLTICYHMPHFYCCL